MSRDLPDNRSAGILLEEERLKLLTFVGDTQVDAFAGGYSEARRLDKIGEQLGIPEGERFEFETDWADEQLRFSASRNGWKSDQVVKVSTGQEDEKDRREKHTTPSYGDE